ncbi:MAG: amino acid adenylation domain-containing protein [Lachnospiraceae bacterium]|nr:amino acid adenylation domain-containing protein [Lachnospiraceae bacterium]
MVSDDKSRSVIYEQFKKVAEKSPAQTAIVEDKRTLTYRELDQRIQMIEKKFPNVETPRADGAKGICIGIVADHGIDQIASIFAVLKTGAAYVPAEPDFPEERIRFMMKESSVSFIITQRKYQDKLQGFPLLFLEEVTEKIPSCLSAEKMAADAAAEILSAQGDDAGTGRAALPDSLAYILYTSGSTGVPKGVCVTNANVCHYVRAFQHEFHPAAGDVMLQYSVCSFDIFVEEVFTTLLSGAALAIPGGAARADIQSLMDFVREKKVTIISGFPYLLMEMNELEAIPSSLRLLISGGDILRESYVNHLLPQVMVYNTYGPSETTVCCSYFRCNGQKALEDGTYPIGNAVPGSQIEILDDNLNPVPDGSTGEICILGDGVSNGYLDKSKNKMFATSADGRPLYRSGDLGYLLPDGNLAFLHRRDSQVMILGKRVEPEEVENVLCDCDEVQTAVVRPFTDEHGLSYLTAYVVPESTKFVLSEVKKKLSRYLTSFMIPEFFVIMDHIPLTPNGKPDLDSLPVVLKEGA